MIFPRLHRFVSCREMKEKFVISKHAENEPDSKGSEKSAITTWQDAEAICDTCESELARNAQRCHKDSCKLGKEMKTNT